MSGTTYTARFIGPSIMEANNANVVACPVYLDGALVAPDTGTLSIWNAANTLVVNAVSVSVVGDVATYTISAPTLASETNSDGWRLEWTLLFGSETATFRTDGSLVHRELYPVVTDADLLRAHTDLARRMPSSETSYQDYLDEAWARIESRLVASGKRPWLILSPSALRDVHTYSTLALIFRDFATGGSTSPEWEMMLRYEALYDASWAQLTFPQADPSTGQDAAPGTRSAGSPTIWLCGR
jgi:hypothetical protein